MRVFAILERKLVIIVHISCFETVHCHTLVKVYISKQDTIITSFLSGIANTLMTPFYQNTPGTLKDNGTVLLHYQRSKYVQGKPAVMLQFVSIRETLYTNC